MQTACPHNLIFAPFWRVIEHAVPRLSLMTGPLKFSFFQQCLGGTIHDKWDVLADGVNETLVNFTVVRDRLIAELVCPTDLADQRHYLETSKKPYCLNCAALAVRLEMINKMMSLFPGPTVICRCKPWISRLCTTKRWIGSVFSSTAGK